MVRPITLIVRENPSGADNQQGRLCSTIVVGWRTLRDYMSELEWKRRSLFSAFLYFRGVGGDGVPSRKVRYSPNYAAMYR